MKPRAFAIRAVYVAIAVTCVALPNLAADDAAKPAELDRTVLPDPRADRCP